MEIKWTPPGKICLNCGGLNPDGGHICGSCDEPASVPNKELLTLEQQREREAILDAVHYRHEAQK